MEFWGTGGSFDSGIHGEQAAGGWLPASGSGLASGVWLGPWWCMVPELLTEFSQ